MDVGNGHLILWRLWLYDIDVTIYGESNSCTLTFRKEIKPKALQPRSNKPIENTKGKEELNLIRSKELEQEITQESLIVFAIQKVTLDSQNQIPLKAPHVTDEFKGIFPEDLPDQ